jgi:RNA polymerase sigma-70 factor (ECF subfamily)
MLSETSVRRSSPVHVPSVRSPPRRLAAAFLEGGIPVEDDVVSLEEALHERVDAGRRQWPTLAVDEEAFVRHLAIHVHRGRLPPLAHAADLWLTFACSRGLRPAIEALHRRYRPGIVRAAARVGGSVAEDVAQRVLASLLLPQGDGAPRIASYGGRSSLDAWLRTIGARAALRHPRREVAAPESVSALAGVVAEGEPELRLARSRHAADLEAALLEALDAMDARECMLLRLHHVDGWSVDRLGALYKVGRSTAARWVAGARLSLLEGTRGSLRRRLGLTDPEVDSLLRGLQSALLEVSLVRLLREKA